MNRSTKYTR